MSQPDTTRVETGEIICSDGMPAFFAQPNDGGKYPCVILMHERYGLVDHTRDLARRCAKDGLLVLAPNFFFRHPDQATLNAGQSRYPISDPEAVELIGSAKNTLKTLAGAEADRVVVAGYCQTGRHPLVFAAEVGIDAAIVWYGAAAKREWEVTKRQPKALEDILAHLPCPVFGAFGTDDHIISINDVRRFRGALEESGKSYEIHLYEGAPHGWMNDTMPGRYRAAQAHAAWMAQQEFVRKIFSESWPKDRIVWQFEGENRRDYDFAKNIRQE
jgi:carboxymethylenebutenolidase